jgi:hypothetical protein
LAVWLYAALLVGLIIAFPSVWWLSLLVTSVVVYGVIAVLIFRIRRGFKADPSNPPSGVLNAIKRGSKRKEAS